MTEPSERCRTGMRTCRAVLANAHVDAAIASTDDFKATFQTLITESAWGSVWSRDQITCRERSMITSALLAGLGHFYDSTSIASMLSADYTTSTKTISRLLTRPLIHKERISILALVGGGRRAFSFDTVTRRVGPGSGIPTTNSGYRLPSRVPGGSRAMNPSWTTKANFGCPLQTSTKFPAWTVKVGSRTIPTKWSRMRPLNDDGYYTYLRSTLTQIDRLKSRPFPFFLGTP